MFTYLLAWQTVCVVECRTLEHMMWLEALDNLL